MHGVISVGRRHDIDESPLVIVQIFVAQGQIRDSRDHQFLLGVFNQIHIPIAPAARPSTDSHKSPFAWTKPKNPVRALLGKHW